MSGTAFGTIVVHVTPEASTGGPLALVRTGDRIRLSARGKRIDLLLDAGEMERRRAGPKIANSPPPKRGYARLYHHAVLSAKDGCDFDFLRSDGGAPSTC